MCGQSSSGLTLRSLLKRQPNKFLPRVTLFRREVPFRGFLPVLAVEKPLWGQHGALNVIEAAGVDRDPVRAHARYPVRMDTAELAENVLRHAGVEPIGRQRICA